MPLLLSGAGGDEIECVIQDIPDAFCHYSGRYFVPVLRRNGSGKRLVW